MAKLRRFAIVAMLLMVFDWSNASMDALDILPKVLNNSYIHRSGERFFLTCKPKPEHQSSIDDIQWLDPLNRIIEAKSSLNEKVSYPELSTQKTLDKSVRLDFYPLKEHHTGNYTCVATYAGTESINKTVTVQTIDPLTWVDAPETQYAILGKPFRIKCEVSAKPAPSVEWQKNDVLITNNEKYAIEIHALKIFKVEDSDEGTYQCSAFVSETGQAADRLIRLEVHEPPKIDELKSEIEIVEGRNEEIPCHAHGKPPPKYSWVKTISKENLTFADRFGVDADKGILTITNINRNDEGEYQCVASNPAGIANINIVINVLVKPKVMEFSNVTIAEGKEAVITCKAFGKPAPEVTFKKQTGTKPFVKGSQPEDDRIVLHSVSDNIKGETEANLTIQNVLRDDDGIYECIATNKVASAFKNGHLTVQFQPSFRSMTNATIWSWEQRPVNLTCIADSIPNATITWKHGDYFVPSPNNEKGYKVDGLGPISTLTVTPFDHRYYGAYKCIARNILGESSHVINLMEAAKPAMIQQSKPKEIGTTSIIFDITPPGTQPELPIRTITAQYKEQNLPWSEAKNRIWTLNSPYVLENLKPLTYYEFRFSATNDVGRGNWGGNVILTTLAKDVPNPPKINVNESQYDLSPFSQQYEINWIIPSNNGEPIELYEVKYCEAKKISKTEWSRQDDTCKRQTIPGQVRSKHLLKGLTPNTFYEVEIRAKNILGESKPAVLRFKTARAHRNEPVLHKGPLLTNEALAGVIIAVVLIILVVFDLIYCCCYQGGIIYYFYERFRRKPVDEEDKLGSLFPLPRFPLPYCDQKMANVATAIQESGKNTIKLVKHTAIEEKEPLKTEKKPSPIINTGLRQESSITFDGKRSISKTGFVSKDSAV